MKTVKTKYLLGFLVISGIAACNNNDSTNTPAVDTTVKTAVADTSLKPVAPAPEKKDVLDTLYTLPFVKESNKYLDSFTKHKHGIAFIVDTTSENYNIRAGYDGEERFETYYIFTINRKTKEIKIQDVISGDMVSPAEFEKRRKVNK